MLDRLEPRRLLSQMSIFGTSRPDSIELSLASTSAAGVDVLVRNAGAQAVTVAVDATSVSLAAGQSIRTAQVLANAVTAVKVIDLGAGNDTLVTGDDLVIPMVISGGKGRDNLKGGGGADLIDGGAADDTLYGQSGSDTLVGGLGTDSLLGQSGNDSLAGGPGDDSYVFGTPTENQRDTVDEAPDAGLDMLDFGTNATPVVVDLSNARTLARHVNGNVTRLIRMAAGELPTNLERITGSGGNDLLYGNANANTIFGGGGNDSIFGVAGDDSVDGGSGNDNISGGDGDDYLSGAIGTDTVAGDAGNDLVVDYGGSNVLTGGDGNDVFINQNGQVDTVDGGPGFDSVQDDDTESTLAGVQNDTFTDAEYVYDVIQSGSASLIAAYKAAPVARQVTPLASSGVYSGVSVSLDKRGVLRIGGSAGDDVITLTQNRRILNISIAGELLPDFDFGTIRRIAIAGGAGNDTIRLQSASGKRPLKLDGIRAFAGDGNDTVVGGNGNDILAGELGDDFVSGGLGNDLLGGDFVVLKGETAPAAAANVDGTDTVVGGEGSTDIVTYTYRTASVNLDLSSPGAASGGAGENDSLSGIEYVVAGQGSDTVVGSAANDTLFGGPGDDHLSGGPGADRLLGGFGSDSIDPNAGADLVDTGGDDGADDTVNGGLDDDGLNPTSADNVLIDGSFRHGNGNDYFALAGRRYGQGA